jgi:DNA-directed RNA polymerase specialized sigma24 family protein
MYKGLTNPEVAKVLRLSLIAVKTGVYGARLFLRDKLSDYFSMNGINNLYLFQLNIHLNK